MPMLRSCAGCAGMEATELSPYRHIREECGVFGIYSPQERDLASLTYYGLYALQHRGQESVGITAPISTIRTA